MVATIVERIFGKCRVQEVEEKREKNLAGAEKLLAFFVAEKREAEERGEPPFIVKGLEPEEKSLASRKKRG